MVPLPSENRKTTYWACCGKMLCTACCEEHERALRATNRKREKKKQPPLEQTCAFCRSPLHKNDAEFLRRFEERVGKDDTVAMKNLAGMYMEGEHGLIKDEVKASELLNRAADLGSAEVIGHLAAKGWSDSILDRTRFKEYLEDAAAKGHVISRAALASLLAGEDNYDLAIKHWHLAAAAGDDLSMKDLWQSFHKGRLSKLDLEKTLRAHKAASDEMKSEERERHDASQEAEAGNDELLENIYDSYYFGFTNTKELKVALKAYRAGDLAAVKRLLASKGMN